MTSKTALARRELTLLLLSQMERGTIADRDRALIRPLVEAEMATLDQIDALDPRNLPAGQRLNPATEEQFEEARKALADGLGDQKRHLNWAQLIEEAGQLARAAGEWMNECEAERSAHEEHRRAMAIVLDLPADADWLAVSRRVTEYRRQLGALAKPEVSQ